MHGAGRPIRLGGPIFKKSDDPRELAIEHRRLGYSAAYCPESKVEDTARNQEIWTETAATGTSNRNRCVAQGKFIQCDAPMQFFDALRLLAAPRISQAVDLNVDAATPVTNAHFF